MSKALNVSVGASIIIVGTIVTLSMLNNTETVVVDSTSDTIEAMNPTVTRTLEIYNSQEFQEEMRTLATARAMFELSQEKQAEALELSEQAMMAYKKSQSMSSAWTNSRENESQSN